MNQINNNRSFLRWAGSKKKLIPILLLECQNNFNKYIEPFVGSGQLYFSVNPVQAVLSDTNRDLIYCYEAIKSNYDLVYSYLVSFPIGKEHYYSLRESDCKDWSLEKRAARFLYLNTFCFNGLYRTNKSGKFNVPFSESSGQLLSYERLRSVAHTLRCTKLVCDDFETVVRDNCASGDLVYLDPPYAIRNKDIFIQYGPETFGLSDLERVTSTLNYINEIGANFILSYAFCDEALKIANDWKVKTVMTVRNISGFSKHRKQEKEVIITNFTVNA